MDPPTILFQVALIGISAIVAYYIGKRQTRELRGEENVEEKNHLIRSLLTELTINHEYLKQGTKPYRNMFGDTMEWFTEFLLTNSFDSAISSGKFILLPPKTQAIVSIYYKAIKNMNKLTSNTAVMKITDLYLRNLEAMKHNIKYLMRQFDEVVINLQSEMEK